jgi:hypothetical protein
MIDTHTVLQRIRDIKRKAAQVRNNPALAAMYMEDIIGLCETTLRDAGWVDDDPMKARETLEQVLLHNSARGHGN